MDTLNIGTKEIVSVYLTDRLGTIDVIPSADFKIVREDESGDPLVDWAAVENITDLRVDCLIDTTGQNWTEGTFKLYVRANIPPEAAIVGPFEFGVS